VNELFPIAGGILLGVLLVQVPVRARFWAGIAGVVLIGFLATVISGEFRIGWEYLLVDIPLVAVASAGTFLLVRRLRPEGLVRSKAD
jgi:hypothetical protein